MQQSNSKAVLVWVDDYFISPEFEKKEDKAIYWEELFGKFSSKIFRLLDISIVVKGTAEDALEFFDNTTNMDGIYYYCILDMYLPKNKKNIEFTDPIYSQDIAQELIEKGIEFSFLSSATKFINNGDKQLQSIDFYTKPQNLDFTLPKPLRQKILHKIKNNVHWLNIHQKLIGNLDGNSSDNIRNCIGNGTPSSLFPFIDGFKDFVELNELDEIGYQQTLFVRSSATASNIYEMQCLLLMFADQILSNNNLSMSYREVTDATCTRTLLDVVSATESIQCFRLKGVSGTSFKKINDKLSGKRRVYIVDSDDMNIEDYMDEVGSYILKDIPIIQMHSSELRTDIVMHTLKYILNDCANKELNKQTSIYFHYPKLLIDPINYIKLTDHRLQIATLDDPNEIISEIFTLYDDRISVLMKANDSKIVNEPISFTDSIEKCDYATEKNYIANAMIFWLQNSWNTHYGVDIKSFRDEFDHTININEWRIKSFEVLIALAKKLEDDTFLCDYKESILDICKILKSSLPNLITGDNDNLNSDLDLLTKIKWPHKYFPVPSIVHDRLEDHGKTFWLQHKCFNYIEYSKDLKREFSELDKKIEYYNKVLELIEKTHVLLPESTHQIIHDITLAIKNEKPILIDGDFKDNFKNLSNIFIRIALNFGLLINKKMENIGYDRRNDDKAKLGTHVATLRDRLFSKKQDIFVLNEDLLLENDKNLRESAEFIVKHTKLFTQNTSTNIMNIISKSTKHQRDLIMNFDEILSMPKLFEHSESYKSHKVIDDPGNTEFKIGDKVTDEQLLEANNALDASQSKATSSFDSPQAYQESIHRADNYNALSQLTNMAKYLSQNDLMMQILKNADTIKLLSYMADTRNSWEHKTGDSVMYFDIDKLFEFFIFSYESIWMFYSFLVSQLQEEDEKLNYKTTYISLDESNINLNKDSVEQFREDFKSKDAFDYYLDKLEMQKNELLLV